MPQTETGEEAGKAPVDCDKDKACLKGKEDFPVCQVEKPIADLLFVTAKPLPPCRHMRFFRSGAYCTCPVRRELHRRHNI